MPIDIVSAILIASILFGPISILLSVIVVVAINRFLAQKTTRHFYVQVSVIFIFIYCGITILASPERFSFFHYFATLGVSLLNLPIFILCLVLVLKIKNYFKA